MAEKIGCRHRHYWQMITVKHIVIGLQTTYYKYLDIVLYLINKKVNKYFHSAEKLFSCDLTCFSAISLDNILDEDNT